MSTLLSHLFGQSVQRSAEAAGTWNLAEPALAHPHGLCCVTFPVSPPAADASCTVTAAVARGAHAIVEVMTRGIAHATRSDQFLTMFMVSLSRSPALRRLLKTPRA
ncbi:hypothetical protein AB0912_23375 [Streptomyces sp. NPDC007084]|uniref:hypothetical protein n=1 Tax=Streptomyces sp. NPDC007084 TaxID=3154313 RepID=UPI0034550C21